MSSKDFKKVKEYFTGGRKLGFTVVIMAQNYVSIPKTIVRNCQYFFIFRPDSMFILLCKLSILTIKYLIIAQEFFEF